MPDVRRVVSNNDLFDSRLLLAQKANISIHVSFPHRVPLASIAEISFKEMQNDLI